MVNTLEWILNTDADDRPMAKDVLAVSHTPPSYQLFTLSDHRSPLSLFFSLGYRSV
jgi:hypothetical protein